MASLWFLVAFLAGIGFFVSYFMFPANSDGTPSIADPETAQRANMLLGGTLALALFSIGAGMTVWVRRVLPHYEVSSPTTNFLRRRRRRAPSVSSSCGAPRRAVF